MLGNPRIYNIEWETATVQMLMRISAQQYSCLISPSMAPILRLLHWLMATNSDQFSYAGVLNRLSNSLLLIP